MDIRPPSFRKNWRFYLKYISLGIIVASIITLMRYYS